METTTPTTLKDARARIDEINERVIELLAERQAIVDDLCKIKADTGKSVRDPEREAELLDHVRLVAEEAGLPPDLAEALFEEILAHSVRRQRRRRGAENGETGKGRSSGGSESPPVRTGSRNGADSSIPAPSEE